MEAPAMVSTYRNQTLHEAIETACGRIAPTWPLDQFAAVNPYWGFLGEAIDVAASRIASYSGSRMLMPPGFYRDQWRSGALRNEHVQTVLNQPGPDVSIEQFLSCMEDASISAPSVPLMTAMADAQRDLIHGMSIGSFVTHHISQHCASWFDRSQSSWEPPHTDNLYGSWLQHTSADRSLRLLMGFHGLRRRARSLPQEPLALIEEALSALPVPQEEWEHYLTALLMSINGWASWCAYERWQARLSHQDDDTIVQLLAIRLAWEYLIFICLLDSKEPPQWQEHWTRFCARRDQANQASSAGWVLQEALEVAYQNGICKSLARKPAHLASGTPAVQAVFCIDVRSEVFRRALETCSESVQTLAFAGFFGLPIAFQPLGAGNEYPQLPVLLAPKLHASESTGSPQKDDTEKQSVQRSLRIKSIWKDFRSSASGTFTFVESFGLFYAFSLLKNTLRQPAQGSGRTGSDPALSAALRPCFVSGEDGEMPSPAMLCDMAAGILGNMSLTTNFARLVLFAGHTAQTVNNPHAAGLACGACGGQSGEVNARLFAQLLNTPEIRAGLLARGIAIPSTTHFLPAVHNTTLDEVTIFDADQVPQSHATDLAQLREWLLQAGHRARMERAGSVGIETNGSSSIKKLLRQFQMRGRDWSQVRPEWGLANNAAFLIAPRRRSRGIDLQGRVFLHEYEPAHDPDGSILEAIMTAPMLVTNWINMQYFASTVDNQLYGSGNKVLHNVVGGRIGVFEGNGGDLRIGLPLQSLHDGQTLRHTPLRLSVLIEAPQPAIERVIRKHETVFHLVHNGWLHLLQIDPRTNSISRYRSGTWEIVTPGLHEEGEGQDITMEAMNA